MKRRLAVVGGGWAGLAAAVEAVERGHAVTLFEMAPEPGGRARTVPVDDLALDNGQHILIGAYSATLGLMRSVGVPVETALLRTPLALVDARGLGLRLPAGAPVAAFARAVLARRGWSALQRGALLASAALWALRGFRCDPSWSVARLTRHLPAAVRGTLIEPLCVAALNTPAEEASAAVFLRVLHDALFAGRGSADLLLPRHDLGRLLPGPAVAWLGKRGARIEVRHRVEAIEPGPRAGWRVDGEAFDAVVLAASSAEAVRLVAPIAPEWSRAAAQLRFEPIVTVYTRADGAALAEPMVALATAADAPAQFVFDRGRLAGHAGVLAWVASGARAWVERGAEATAQATLAQARREFGRGWADRLQVLRVVTDKRATFRCTPGLVRPPMGVAPGLAAAGDYVDGPYPATLEGAVRSGLRAAAFACDAAAGWHAGIP